MASDNGRPSGCHRRATYQTAAARQAKGNNCGQIEGYRSGALWDSTHIVTAHGRNDEGVYYWYADFDEDNDGYNTTDQGDGVVDAFPSEGSQWADADGDGYGDNPAPTTTQTLRLLPCPLTNLIPAWTHTAPPLKTDSGAQMQTATVGRTKVTSIQPIPFSGPITTRTDTVTTTTSISTAPNFT